MFEKIKLLIKMHKTQIIVAILLATVILPLGDDPIVGPF
jgi:hypothetical protein